MKLVDTCKYFENRQIDEGDDVVIDQLTWCFILYVLGRTLFSNSGPIHFLCLPSPGDIYSIVEFNWGGAGMGVIYRFMCAISIRKTKSFDGFSFVWEVCQIFLVNSLHVSLTIIYLLNG